MLNTMAEAAVQEQSCIEDWEQLAIRGVGRAVAPYDRFPVRAQAKVMALEGARAMAYGPLCECIVGVRVTKGTKVKDGIPTDEIVKYCEGFIKGAVVKNEEVEEDAQAAMGVVTLEIALRGEKGVEGQLPPKLSPPPPPPQPRQEPRPAAPPPPATPAFNGLILDARGLAAYPALYPEVLAEGGRGVYHWHDVDREHRTLFGRVTNAVEKAKALLQQQGATNPLVVRVARMEGPTTYVISAADAKKVISADLQTQFLRKSQVVFVLGL